MSENGTAIVIADAERNTAPAIWTPSFAVAIDEAVERVSQKRRFFEEVMREGEDGHYGKIPGGSKKPVLFKSGAELLLANMGLQAELTDAEPPVRDYTGVEHGGEPLIAYRRICRIYRQIGPTEAERMKVAQAEGFCTSRETKYRWRDAKPLCPECGGAFIHRSKFPDRDTGDQGYFCFKKVGGCGAQFASTDRRIADQPTGRIPNPDVADLENTILKMADKRALVASALIATGCSDIFTQDIEDSQPEAADHSPAEQPRNVTPPASGQQHRHDPPPQNEAPNEELERKRLVRAIYARKGVDPKSTDKQDHYTLLCDVAYFHGLNAVPESWSGYTLEQLQAYLDAPPPQPQADEASSRSDAARDEEEFDRTFPPHADPEVKMISEVQRHAIDDVVAAKRIAKAQLVAIIGEITAGKALSVELLTYDQAAKVLAALQAAGARRSRA